MPVLPHLFQRAASAADTRIVDSRQLLSAPHQLGDMVPRLIARATKTLKPRQQNTGQGTVAIPTVYQGLNAGPAPGAVVGITLGAIAGFLLIVALLYSLSNGGGSFIRATQDQEEEVVVRRRSRSPRRTRSHRTEMSQSAPRRDRVVRQERIIRDFPPSRSPNRDREASRIRETVLVEESRPERRVEGDDIVEVIEEHSSIADPPPRRKGRRQSSGYRSVASPPQPPVEDDPVPPGSWRPVDPSRFAGGNFRPHHLR